METGSDYLVFGIGNPLLDISVDCKTDELIKKYELPVGGACLAEEKHMPIYDEMWRMEGVETIPGGSALNTIRSTNWMLQKGNPNKCVYFGCIGKDEKGDVLEKETLGSGIKGVFHHLESDPTGTCAVVVHNKERALCANLAACLKFPLDHLKSNMSYLEKTKVIYTTSFFITSNFDALIETAKYATGAKKPFCLNLSAVFLIEFNTEQVDQALTYADYVFGNEDEIEAYGKKHGIEGGRKEIAMAIAKSTKVTATPRHVVITQGKDPVIVAINTPGSETVDVKEFEVPAVSDDKIVDTNGAGDAFAGGFLSQLSQDKDLATCVKAGNYCSSEIIQRSGCTFPAENKFE